MPHPVQPAAFREALAGQVVLITGTSSGLGRASALAFAAAGARLVLTARRADRLDTLAAEIRDSGADCATLPGNAIHESLAEAAVALALERFGRLDALIHCAGQGNYKPLLETSAAEFDELLNTNLRSTFLFARAAARPMVEQRAGTIVIVSSIAGLRGAANETVYSATKFAQIGFAESLDLELRPHGIKVCTLAPGGMKTEFALGRGRDADRIAASPMMHPADAAQTVLFLCSQPPGVRIPLTVLRHMG